MKVKTLIFVFCLAAGGCSHTSPTFSWYHPMGGEYLFSFDASECESNVKSQGLSLGTDTQGPFFECMHNLGYYLVDANGIVQAPPTQSLAEGPQVTFQ